VKFSKILIQLAIVMVGASASGACSAESTIWAPNLPYFWLETIADSVATAKRYPGSILDTDCVVRYHEYRSAARLRKIWLPKPIIANVSSNIKGQIIDTKLKSHLSAHGVVLEKDKGVPVDILTIPRSSKNRTRLRPFGIPESAGRPGIIELLYADADSGNCHVPVTEAERARNIEEFHLKDYKVPGVDMDEVYLSPRMLLPEIATTIVENWAVDQREPPSESIALVDANGRIIKLQCFISDFYQRPKALRAQIIKSCFDIFTVGSSKKPILRRYFDDAN
jgi:hypothetical protein